MSTDITKPTAHIYWLYILLLGLALFTARGYIALRDNDEYLSEKIAKNEMGLRIQLAGIEAQLAQINLTLAELKQDFRNKGKQP